MTWRLRHREVRPRQELGFTMTFTILIPKASGPLQHQDTPRPRAGSRRIRPRNGKSHPDFLRDARGFASAGHEGRWPIFPVQRLSITRFCVEVASEQKRWPQNIYTRSGDGCSSCAVNRRSATDLSLGIRRHFRIRRRGRGRAAFADANCGRNRGHAGTDARNHP